VTSDLLDEVRLMDFDLQNLAQELTALKRTSGIRENSLLRLEERITEISNR